ncbi:hypothetical protein LJR016_002284 [Devosia sp. LjRoot16]|uniref:hypothetical protein n=1 Tax=Devosia sp. LjRoot16 TaxID=3342271 RepID=UPI003ED004AA
MTFTRCVPTALALSTELGVRIDQRPVTTTGRFVFVPPRLGGDDPQNADLSPAVEEGYVDFSDRSDGIGPKMTAFAISCTEGDFGRLRDVDRQKSPDVPETPELTIMSGSYCFHEQNQ